MTNCKINYICYLRVLYRCNNLRKMARATVNYCTYFSEILNISQIILKSYKAFDVDKAFVVKNACETENRCCSSLFLRNRSILTIFKGCVREMQTRTQISRSPPYEMSRNSGKYICMGIHPGPKTCFRCANTFNVDPFNCIIHSVRPITLYHLLYDVSFPTFGGRNNMLAKPLIQCLLHCLRCFSFLVICYGLITYKFCCIHDRMAYLTDLTTV